MTTDTLHLTVLQCDAENGEPGNPWQCAIVKAFHRLYPHYTAVTVGRGTIGISDKSLRARFTMPTPMNARKLQAAFDRSRESGLDFIGDGVRFKLHLDEAEIADMPDPAPRRTRTAPPKPRAPRTSKRRAE